MLTLSESFAASFEPKCYIVKVSNICNLSCSYCYYYGSGGFAGLQKTDDDYPDVISLSTLSNLFSFARSAAEVHGTQEIHFCWHGGEPMCVPAGDFREMLKIQRGVLGSSSIKIKNTIQTNATMITSEWAALLREFDFGIGVSIDGLGGDHNKHRKSAAGADTFKAVISGVNALLSEGLTFSALTVVDGSHSLLPAIDFLIDTGVKSIDFLPLMNVEGKETGALEAISKRVVEAFLFIKEKKGVDFSFRTASAMRRLYVGKPTAVCSIGEKRCYNFNSIMPNGDITMCENFVAAGFAGAALNLNVNDKSLTVDRFRQALYASVKAIDASQAAVYECQSCEVLDMCGGGCLSNRYVNGKFETNIYCQLFKDLSNEIQQEMEELFG
ncbi:MAG: radical SAM protein [Nitrospirae bacterium]|nr:radical SAM protein [Nitrospirota bacterium]